MIRARPAGLIFPPDISISPTGITKFLYMSVELARLTFS
jgi:hypothetical protein